MQSNEIQFGKQSVKEVFQDWYRVPSYQRNYVWGDDQIDDLLEDLRLNWVSHQDNEYFLGSYIKQVNKQDKDSPNDLLDGQQRITTLFLLFAYLRDFAKDNNGLPFSDRLQPLIYQKGDVLFNTPTKVRLDYQIRGDANKFIADYIVPPDAIRNNWATITQKAGETNGNETIVHVSRALCYFKKYFDDNPISDITSFIAFILNKVVLIFVSADNLDDAFRLFSIMNDRGLKLSNADILKSINLEEVSNRGLIDYYAGKWEELQDDLGEGIDRFLMYIRASLVKTRAKVNLLDEFEKNVFDKGLIKKGDEFFNKVLAYYDDYEKLILLQDNTDKQYRNLLHIMHCSLPGTDWIPVLLYYNLRFKGTDLLEFTKRLAYKAVADIICGDGPSVRIENLYKIMSEIDNVSNFTDLLSTGCLSFDQGRFVTGICGDVYGRLFAKPLLMLLEYDLQDNDNEKTFSQISIEHILPQTPPIGSKWETDFSEKDRLNWTHKIGNLIIISRRKNSSLGNKDYQEKRELYFKNNIGSFARSLQLYTKYPTQWTLAEIKQNQNDIYSMIERIFKLNVTIPREK